MQKVLVINASSNTDESSRSRSLVEYFKTNWKEKFPNDKFIVRDVAMTPPPHINQTTITAFYTPEQELLDASKKSLQLSDELIDELNTANILLFGCPMHNFGVPSTLKAYFDLITRVNQTFEFTENGPKGKVQNKKAIVIITQGGFHANKPTDQQTPYFKTILNFLGIKEIYFFYGEGLDISSDFLKENIQKAKNNIKNFINNT